MKRRIPSTKQYSAQNNNKAYSTLSFHRIPEVFDHRRQSICEDLKLNLEDYDKHQTNYYRKKCGFLEYMGKNAISPGGGNII